MSEEGQEVGFTIPGGWSMHARGPIALFVTILLAFIVISSGISLRGFRDIESTHRDMLRELRVQTCVLSLAADERLELRTRASQRGTSIEGVMMSFCPWMSLAGIP